MFSWASFLAQREFFMLEGEFETPYPSVGIRLRQ